MAGLKDFPQFGALSGLKVLDSGSNIAGPLGGGLLSECGSTVIHFEAPNKPDNQRGWYGYPQNHRNQLSMVADIKTEEGREIFFKLIKWADIWVESSKGGQYDRLGLSDEEIWKVNPKLAIVHVSGYGQTGDPAYVTKASYDAVGQAFSGYMSLNGTTEALKVNPYLSDFVCGLTTCWTMLACYVSTMLTGKGESVDVAQYEALARIMDGRMMQYATDDIKMPRTGNKDTQAALFSFYTCKDGKTIFIGMTGAEVCKRGYPLIGLPVPGTGDPDFPEGFTGWLINSPVGQRMEAAVEKFVSENTMEEVEALMHANQIPCQRVYELEDCLNDPHWKARETVMEWDDPMMGRVKGLGLINKFKNNPSQIWRGAPLFGMDNKDILKDLGYSDEEIQSLYEKGITKEFDLATTIKRYRLEEVIPHMRKK
ncbi:bile acid CoA-transferase BaiF [Proteocatella sphenisci]|uniref:bile acid CoA-transferase BaiF n=1 Tax=Proteocatella sphenisci TaxID=181070 RepID=UPI00048B63AB|nr:bile acid CoA-transferase BaiF [Proteocatella sphenisci]